MSFLTGRAVCVRGQLDHADQVPAAPAGQVPRPDGREQALQTASPGHDSQPGGAGRLPRESLHHLRHPPDARQGRLPGGDMLLLKGFCSSKEILL